MVPNGCIRGVLHPQIVIREERNSDVYSNKRFRKRNKSIPPSRCQNSQMQGSSFCWIKNKMILIKKSIM